MCLCEHSVHGCMWEKPHHPVCVYVSILCMAACERNPHQPVCVYVSILYMTACEGTPPTCMCLCEYSLHDCMWGNPHHSVCVYASILYMTACEETPTTLYVSMRAFFTWLHVRKPPPPCMCLCEHSMWHHLYLNHTDGSNKPPMRMIVDNSWLHRLTLTFVLIQHNSMKFSQNKTELTNYATLRTFKNCSTSSTPTGGKFSCYWKSFQGFHINNVKKLSSSSFALTSNILT